MVGAVVILIVVTAGMVSTTWVQFLKGALLVVFSAILTWMILQRGFKVEKGGNDGHEFQTFRTTADDLTNGDGKVGSLDERRCRSRRRRLGEIRQEVRPATEPGNSTDHRLDDEGVDGERRPEYRN
jgi:Na+(H+)/acetate symporter ActP